LAGKTLEEHFREQAELIDKRFAETRLTLAPMPARDSPGRQQSTTGENEYPRDERQDCHQDRRQAD
jgi:hypothetical protein